MWISKKELDAINEKMNFLAFECLKLKYPSKYSVGDRWDNDKNMMVIRIEDNKKPRINESTRTFTLLDLKTKQEICVTEDINPKWYLEKNKI